MTCDMPSSHLIKFVDAFLEAKVLHILIRSLFYSFLFEKWLCSSFRPLRCRLQVTSTTCWALAQHLMLNKE
jgi:hypothetical protein